MILVDGGIDFYETVERFENALILAALERARWNKNQAARLLRINRTTLVEKLKSRQQFYPELANAVHTKPGALPRVGQSGDPPFPPAEAMVVQQNLRKVAREWGAWLDGLSKGDRKLMPGVEGTHKV